MNAPTSLCRAAGAGLLLAAVLVLGSFVDLVLDDPAGALALLVFVGVVAGPVLVSAGLAVRPAVALLRARPAPSRTLPVAVLLAIGNVGVVALALQPGLDRAFDDGDLAGAAVGTLGLLGAALAAAVVAPGRPLALRLLLGLSAALLVLGVVVARAVAQTA